MTAIKKNWEAIAAFLCIVVLLVVTTLSLWPSAEYDGEVAELFQRRSLQYLFYAAIGLLAGVLIMLLVKEHHLYYNSWIIFGVLMAVLAVQLRFDDHSHTRRYISIGTFSLGTVAMIPLALPAWARFDERTLREGYGSWLLMLSMVVSPAALLIAQPHIKAAFLLFGVFTTFLFCSGTKRVRKLLIALGLMLCFTVIVLTVTGWFGYSYTIDRLDAIIFRGRNDPNGWGYMRVLLDEAFSKTPFVGESKLVLKDKPICWYMLNWNDHSLMVVLTRLGWCVAAVILAASVLFLFCIFRMVYKTRQSTYGRNLSLLAGLCLLFGTAVSVISLFLLEYSYCNPPFMFQNEETAIMTFALFAVVVRLYLDREKPSEIARLESEAAQEEQEEDMLQAEWDLDEVDVISNGKYPANMLSNFYPHRFEIDGVRCNSMEGFLQSLKTRNPKLQQKVCQLSGKEAKRFFRRRPENLLWKLTGWLYWRGEIYDRHSDDYQHLLNRAFLALLENEDFAGALRDTEGRSLIHSVGGTSRKNTILTEYEFVERLYFCRLLDEGQRAEKNEHD